MYSKVIEPFRNKVLFGSVHTELKQVTDESIHCVITSPPYYGLRDYKTEPVIWPPPEGNNWEECEHDFELEEKTAELRKGLGMEKLGEQYRGGGKKAGKVPKVLAVQGFCKKCNTWKGNLGLEPTPELFIYHIVLICREIKRVLRKDGTFWLNMGDSYWGSGNSTGHTSETKNLGRKTFDYGAIPTSYNTQKKHRLYKPKDLMMMPARIALALMEDGWYVRCDNIWNKRNPMPESVSDRPSRNHEYVFMLSKSRRYYFDQEAVREDNESNYSDIKKMLEKKDRIGGKTLTADDPLYKANLAVQIGQKRAVGDPFGRNRRSVWDITTTPFSEAHFATFPPKLVELCLFAGTSEWGCCADCGAPYERIVEKLMPNEIARADSETKYDKENDSAGRLATYRQGQRKYKSKYVDNSHGQELQQFQRSNSQVGERDEAREIAEEMFPDDKELQQRYINYIHDHGARPRRKTIGWKKTCNCKTEDKIPAIVLDPFFGSGTTGLVAKRSGRSYLGVELQKDYAKVQAKRLGSLKDQELLNL